MSNPDRDAAEARDRELIRACQGGSQAALRELWDRHYRMVYNLAYRMLGSHEDAEELAPEVFLKIWRSCGRFQGRSRVTTWIYQVASNLAVDRLRSRRSRSHVLLDDLPKGQEGAIPSAEEGVHPEEAYLRTETAEQLHQALGKLSPEDRLLITMYHLQGLSYEEIHEVTGISNPNIKSKLFRARQRLKKHLAPFRDDLHYDVQTDSDPSGGLLCAPTAVA